MLIKRIILIACFSVILVHLGNAQSQSADLRNLNRDIIKKFKVPASEMSDCASNYTVVSLQVDKSAKVYDVNVLNDVSPFLKISFKFLKGYQFPEPSAMNDVPIIFVVSIVKKMKCNTGTSEPNAASVLKEGCSLHKKQG